VPVHPLDYSRVLFSERQRPRGPAAWIMMGCLTGLTVAAVLAAALGPGGADLHGFLVITTIVATVCAMFVTMRLTVTVTSHDLRIGFFPFFSKRVAVHEIVEVEVQEYRPFREFGGWGVRWSLRDSTTCYTMSGTRGVRIITKSGKKYLIGSAKPDALAAAIDRARHEAL
jgi:hypothetical protein